MALSEPLPTWSSPRAEPAPPLAVRYAAVRERSCALAAPLSPEDAMVQSMADASPSKWHLAHTTWFYTTFAVNSHIGSDRFDSFECAIRR